MQFFLIYCREAHPIDGERPGDSLLIEDPITTAERRLVAKKFVEDSGVEMPALLDQVDDRVSIAYASHPDRLYLIGKDGKIAYGSEKGPIGFKPTELKKAIETELGKNQGIPKDH